MMNLKKDQEPNYTIRLIENTKESKHKLISYKEAINDIESFSTGLDFTLIKVESSGETERQ
ncbi:MAG TPA: hypothetical protein VGK25_06245 [Ignavibacteria bacterium]|jgi:hypothetical protein